MIYLLSKTVLHGRHTTSASLPPKLLSIFGIYPFPFSLRSISTSQDKNSFTVSYLIETCGLSPKSASSVAKNVNLTTPKKPDSVIAFFKELGFSKSQIGTIIQKRPELLLSNTKKTLMPKIEFLRSKNVSDSEIPKILCSSPNLLLCSLKMRLIPHYDFLREFLQSDTKALQVLKRFPYFLCIQLEDSLLININTMRENGATESYISTVFSRYPGVFWHDPDKFQTVVEQVLQMGFNPSTFNFVLATASLRSISRSTWEKKVELYKNFGFSDEDVLKAFRTFPLCMAASEAKIVAMLDFLVHKMGFEPSLVASRTVVIGMSFEKRVLPRGLFALDLMARGLIKEFNLFYLFYTTEEKFLQKFVYCCNESDLLLKLFEQKKTSSSKMTGVKDV